MGRDGLNTVELISKTSPRTKKHVTDGIHEYVLGGRHHVRNVRKAVFFLWPPNADAHDINIQAACIIQIFQTVLNATYKSLFVYEPPAHESLYFARPAGRRLEIEDTDKTSQESIRPLGPPENPMTLRS